MFEFSYEALPLPSLQVVFRHPAQGTPRGPTTPGFSLSWHIRSSSTSNIEELPAQSDNWTNLPLLSPKWVSPRLVETVLLATKARKEGITREQLVERAQDKKAGSSTLCSGREIKPCSFPIFTHWLRSLSVDLSLPSGSSSTFPTEEDKAVGLELYFRLIYCSRESQEAINFVEKLMNTDNPATLLLATINTIQGDRTRDPAVWQGFRDFYLVLERQLGLQYGKILLAIASLAELRAMLARDWPYIDSYRRQVESCIEGDCVGVEEIIGGLGTSLASSLFSPHLLDSGEAPQPFALIPFCAYQGNLKTLGKEIPSMTSPICSKFKSTILGGELCHHLKIGVPRTKYGEKQGIEIVLDSIPAMPNAGFELSRKTILQYELHQQMNGELALTTQAKVYIPTLARFEGEGHGAFTLTDLKLMAGTERFLAKKDSVKGCSLQSYEDCHTEGFLKQVEEQCGCLPWSLSPALTHQVRAPPFPHKAANYCTPATYSCYSSFAREDFGCRESCTGLYADVLHTEDMESLNNPRLISIMEEYQRYKASYVRNIQFDGEMSNKGECESSILCFIVVLSETTIPYQQLQFVTIHLSTATYDKIEKDEKVTTEAAMGLIGGTMGLFTGFSILSGVEILYFCIKYLLSQTLAIWKRPKQKLRQLHMPSSM